MQIDGREIGRGLSPYVIAEIASEHCGSLEKCRDLMDAARWAGADAVKLQLYDPVRLAEARGGAAKILADGPWAGRTLVELYAEAHTPRDWFEELFAYARELGITVFSSVFHIEDIPFLEAMGCPAYKIASFELTDCDLIRACSETGKPVILSTGMAADWEISEATCATYAAASDGRLVPRCDLAILHCVSAYPCSLADANLQRITHLLRNSAVPVGLSDHTLGNTAPIVATALGASIIEKHITLSRAIGGPDKRHSLEPHDFKSMVLAVERAHLALGTGKPSSAEETYRSLRRTKEPAHAA